MVKSVCECEKGSRGQWDGGWEPDVVTDRCFLMQENLMTHAKDGSTRLVFPSSDSTRSCRFRPKWIWYYNAVTQAYATYTHKNISYWNYGKCNLPHYYFPSSTAKSSAVNISIQSIMRNKASMNNNKHNISVHLCQLTLQLLFLRKPWWLNVWLMEKCGWFTIFINPFAVWICVCNNSKAPQSIG